MQPWENDGSYIPYEKGTIRSNLKRKVQQFALGLGMASIVYIYLLRSIIRDTTNQQNTET